jgi:hypothetical protein
VFSKLLQIITPQFQKSPTISTTADILTRKGRIALGKDAFVVSILDA